MLPPPLGFVPLRAAADVVGRKVAGADWRPIDEIDAIAIACNLDPDVGRIITMIAERCEAGEIGAAYRSVTGVDDLDRSVWQSPCWRNYFTTGTIDLDLPWLVNGRPVTDGSTVRCTREIFVRRQDLDRFVKTLRSEPRKPVARASSTRIREVVAEYKTSLNGANPSIPGLERFAREKANLRGHRNELRAELERQSGNRPRGRPPGKLPAEIAEK
jgi:hypothetical protein